ncbi:hypothetical protein RDABS01_025371 [Bienertia sinuspersici]
MNEPEKFIGWVRRAETLFNYEDYDDRKRCKVAECKLAGYASLWYENLKKKRHKEGRERTITWRHFRKHMRKKFVSADYIQDLYIKMQSYEKGSNSVKTNVAEFQKLCMLCNLEENEEHKIARFLAGLNPDISEKVDVQLYWSFKELCKVALRMERKCKGKRTTPQKSNPKTYDGVKFFEKSKSTGVKSSPLNLKH